MLFNNEAMPFKQGVRSSNLRWSTTSSQASLSLRRFFVKRKNRLSPAPLLLLSKSNPLRWASIWFCRSDGQMTVCFQLIGNSEEVLLNCFIKNSGHLPSSAVAASAASRRALNLSRFSARSAAKAGVRISAGAPRRRKLRSACDDFS